MAGNLGDHKALRDGEGVNELRIDHGSGIRIYFAKRGKEILLILCGGSKSKQNADIKKAVAYWREAKEKELV